MKAIDQAVRFLGEREKPNNGGFYNAELQSIMSVAGHKKGEAWCAYFAEAMFVLAYPERERQLRQFFNASCVQSFRNFRDGIKVRDTQGTKHIDSPFEISQKPVYNSLVLWQRYKNGTPTGLGHAGIVAVVLTDTIFTSVEGNTNRDGHREGDSVQIKSRSMAWTQNGLNVMGFVIIEP